MNTYKLCAFADEADGTVEGQIRALTENGIPYLELRGLETGSAIALSDRGARELKKRLDDAGIAVWSMGSPIGKIGVTDPFAPHVEQFRRTLEVGAILGAKCVRMFSFYMPKDDPDRARYRDEVLSRLTRLAEEARGSGLTLCHENEKGIYGEKAPECLDIMKNVPGMRAVFDPANFIQSGQETLAAWELLAPYVAYLHIRTRCRTARSSRPAGAWATWRRSLQGSARRAGRCSPLSRTSPFSRGFPSLNVSSAVSKKDVYPSQARGVRRGGERAWRCSARITGRRNMQLAHSYIPSGTLQKRWTASRKR